MENTATLPRIDALEPPPVIDEKQFEFGKAVAEILGYHELDREREQHARLMQGYADQQKLFEACVAAGIRPFLTDAVTTYMAEAQRNEPVPHTRAGIMGTPKPIGSWSWRVYDLDQYGQQRENYGGQMIDMVGPTEAFSVTSTAALFPRGDPGYAKPVPKGVLAHALKLKAELPDVEFKVHALEFETFKDREERLRREADPFLEAIYKGAKFFIAVWNEPDFDAAYE